MSKIAVSQSQKRALGIATGLALIIGVYFLKSYFLLIVFAAIVAFIFNPLYKRLLRGGRRPGTAASITFLATLLAFIVPIILVILVSIHQIVSLVHAISDAHYSANVSDFLKHGVDTINRALKSLHIPYTLSVDTITNGLSHALKTFASSLVGNAAAAFSSFFAFFTLAIIYVYVFLSILIKQNELTETFHYLNPLGRDISNLYLKKMAAMTKAMVRGQFIIAFAQGLTDAALLYVGGLHNTFIFFLLLLTLLSIIPLGGGIVAIPIGVVMLLTGHIWQGLLVILGHIIIVTNIDNVLRPRLVPSEARLDPALTLLSVFAGLKFFGFLGVIMGPILMILIVTTIQVFMEVYHDVDRAQSGSRGTKNRRLWLFWKKQPIE